jgi:uncharacterized RDD family membrane protein YckC
MADSDLNNANQNESAETDSVSQESASSESVEVEELVSNQIENSEPTSSSENVTEDVPQWFTDPNSSEPVTIDPSDEEEQAAMHSNLSEVFTRASLGGALIGWDTLIERLEQIEAAESTVESEQRDSNSVLVPAEQWEETFGVSADTAARHLMLGMMVDARNRARSSGRILDRLTTVTGNTIKYLFGPLSSSRAISPVRKGFGSAVERGESQVNHWMAMGRAVDARSRSTAELAFEQTADDAMDEIIDNERVQIFIQEIVQAQSQGMIDEVIEEIRERGISADNFLERPFRLLLRRPNRSEVPPPSFAPNLVRPQSRRHLPIRKDSLLGYYAGFVSRAVALALDVAFLAVFLAVTGWLLSAILNLLGFQNIREAIPLFDNFSDLLSTILISLNGVTIALAYFLVLWIFTGQTLGMMIMGLRVVAKDGSPLSFWQGLLRIFGLVISSLFLFLGYIWVIIDDRKQGWHDKIAGSYVVYSWDARPDETFLMQYVGRLGR